MRKQLLGVVSVAALTGLVGLAGCGDDDDDDDDDDIVIVPDAAEGPDADPSGGDGNDDFGDAQALTLDGAGTAGRIQAPLDHDFFKVDLTAGTWIQIVTEANAMDSLDEVDTVITMYDASMTQVAENDDAVPRINTDSEVIFRIPTTGTYYIEVLEYTEWDVGNDPPEGEDTILFDYVVIARTVDPNAVGVLEDPETGDNLASATDAKFDMGAGVIVGDFNDNTDVDVFRLAVGATMGPLTLSSAVAPDGADGYGSTTSPGNVSVTNEAGTQILARIDATTGAFQVSPPINPSTNYLVWIEHPGGATGANDFYVYKFFLGQGNPPEAETGMGQNDTTLTAELLTDNGAGSHFILSNIQDGGDLDYFKFSASAGKTISVACAGQSAGSGVRGFTAQVRDQDDGVLATQLEPVGAGVNIQDVNASYTGQYYLRLTKSGQDAEVTGKFARCGVHVQ